MRGAGMTKTNFFYCLDRCEGIGAFTGSGLVALAGKRQFNNDLFFGCLSIRAIKIPEYDINGACVERCGMESEEFLIKRFHEKKVFEKDAAKYGRWLKEWIKERNDKDMEYEYKEEIKGRW